MSDQNTPEGEDLDDIKVSFVSEGEGNVIMTTKVFGLSPSLIVETGLDEETEGVNIDIKVYGTNRAAEFLELVITTLESIKDQVALEAARVVLEQEREEDGPEQTEHK